MGIIDHLSEKVLDMLVDWLGKKTCQAQERQHRVFKLLKILGIAELKNDFASVYMHALVDYAVDAPYPDLARLFAADNVSAALHKESIENKKNTFTQAINQELRKNPKLSILRAVYSASKSIPTKEIKRFRDFYETFSKQIADPLLLKMYNKLLETKMILAEERGENFACL